MQPVARAQAEDQEEAMARAALVREAVLVRARAAVQDPAAGPVPAVDLAALEAVLVRGPVQARAAAVARVPVAAVAPVQARAAAAARVPVAAVAPVQARAAAAARVPADQAAVAEVEEARAQCTVGLTAASVTAGSIRAKLPNPRPHLRVTRTVIKRVELTSIRLTKFLANGASNFESLLAPSYCAPV
jgi:hypothetical protein